MKPTGSDFVSVCRERRQTDKSKKYQSVFPMFDASLPNLPSTWVWASVSELCERVSVGHVGPTSEFFTTKDEGVPFVRSQDVRPGRLMVETVAHVTRDFHNKLKKSQLKSGDVLVVRVGANRGDCCVVPVKVGDLNCANIVFARPMFPNGFIGFFLRSQLGQGLLASLTTGSAQGVLNTQSIAAVPVPTPPAATQHKVAGVLSAYDDLIENNTRRIAILEEMAQSLYREWFVNFRFPGHDKVKLINSPMGMIPEGWKAQSIGSTLDFHIGGGWGQDAGDDEFNNPAFVIRGTDIPDARTLCVVDCPLRFHTESNIRSRKLRPNDLAFEVSGGSKGQPVGRCLFVSERLLKRFDRDVICASFCKLIRANPAILAPEILYHYLVESYTDGTIEQYEVQSTGIKNFKFTVFLESESLAVPPGDVQEAFIGHVRPILDAIHVLGKKSGILRNTRDLLLPKLISGQLDVEVLDIETGEPLGEAEA